MFIVLGNICRVFSLAFVVGFADLGNICRVFFRLLLSVFIGVVIAAKSPEFLVE